MIKTKIQFFCTFILIFCITNGSTKDLYDIYVKRISCSDSDPKIIYNFSCVTHTISRNITTHDVLVFTQPDVIFENLYAHVDYLIRIGNSYRRSLISMEENFCGFLAGTTKSHLIQILWPFLKKSSNLADSCPYRGPFNVSGLMFDDSLLPPALPEGQARVDIHVHTGLQRLSLIKVKVYVEVKPNGAAKLVF